MSKQAVNEPARIGRPALYPWDEWFGRERFDLVHDEDYHCGRLNMAAQIRSEASTRKLKVSVVETAAGLTVVVRGKQGDK